MFIGLPKKRIENRPKAPFKISKIISFNKPAFDYFMKYLCISMAVIILMLPLYAIANRTTRDIVSHDVVQDLSKRFWDFQSKLEAFQKYTYIFSHNKDIQRLSLSDFSENSDAIYLYNINNYFTNEFINDELSSEIIIQFDKNNTLVTNSRVYTDKKIFYQDYFNYDNISYEQWQNTLFNEKSDVIGVNKVHSIYYPTSEMFTLNYYYPNKYHTSIIISYVISLDNISSALLSDTSKDYCNLTLTYNGHTPIMNYSSDPNDKHANDILTITSEKPAITLNAQLTSKAYSVSTLSLQHTLLIYVALAVLVALILSYAFTKYSMRPVKLILDFITKHNANPANTIKNVYEYIYQALRSISKSEDELLNSYEVIHSSFESTIFELALKGLCIEPAELNKTLGHISALKSPYVLVGMCYDSSDEESGYNHQIAILTAKELLKQYFKSPYIFESDLLYAVLNIKMHNTADEIYNKIDIINQHLIQKHNISMLFGMSKEIKDLTLLETAANQVHAALKSIKADEYEKIVQYDNETISNSSYSYINSDLLLHLLNQSDVEPLDNYLQSIKDTAQKKYKYVPVIIKTMYYSILSVYQKKLLTHSHSDNRLFLKEYNSHISIKNNMEYLYKVGLELQSYSIRLKEIESSGLMQDVFDYIDKNYSSSQLCLTMIADHFSTTERHLSSLFYKYTCSTYTEYIKELRIKKTKELLLNSRMQINDIAISVGYDLPNTLYKAFKKETGLSPRQFRNNAGGL